MGDARGNITELMTFVGRSWLGWLRDRLGARFTGDVPPSFEPSLRFGVYTVDLNLLDNARFAAVGRYF